MKSQWQNSRDVTERVYLSGVLELETPAHFGNGDTEALTDIPLLLDTVDGKSPLLTGTSVAGALRNYLREYEKGFGIGENQDGSLRAERLFGHLEGQEASVESWVFVDDALGEFPQKASVEIRDGVTIDPTTRTAKVDEDGRGEKFDIELLVAGTTFELQLELWLTEDTKENLESLAIALKGLENGEIGLGMRKRRGFGRCHVKEWRVQHYKMGKPESMIGWLNHKWDDETGRVLDDIYNLLDHPPALQSQRETFSLDVVFKMESSLLIGSSTGEGNAPDTVHLHSWRDGEEKPILPGTSLAGVIRHRAQRITKTLFQDEEKAQEFVDGMFGRDIQTNDDIPTGSRVIVDETEIENSIDDRVFTRVKIDRFTGGAYPNALFSQQPVFSKPDQDTLVKMQFELRNTTSEDQNFNAEVGLLLLILKDLWTGDLPIGGESGIGRGRLQGLKATLQHKDSIWKLSQSDEGELDFDGNGNPDELEKVYLQAFKELI